MDPMNPGTDIALTSKKFWSTLTQKAIVLSLWERGPACMAGDNLHKSMRSVVIDTGNYDWEGDQPLRHPMSETIVYEMHVGGFTKSPTSGVANPGTYLGLIEKIPYLKSLGITAVELLPVCSFDHTDVMKVHEGRKLVNYWGYSTMGYFAPHQGVLRQRRHKQTYQ